MSLADNLKVTRRESPCLNTNNLNSKYSKALSLYGEIDSLKNELSEIKRSQTETTASVRILSTSVNFIEQEKSNKTLTANNQREPV